MKITKDMSDRTYHIRSFADLSFIVQCAESSEKEVVVKDYKNDYADGASTISMMALAFSKPITVYSEDEKLFSALDKRFGSYNG